MCKEYKLDTNRDQEFLSQHRKDPLSKEVFSAGKYVVVCKNCKTVFMESTWSGYLKGVCICGSSETSTKLPNHQKLDWSSSNQDQSQASEKERCSKECQTRSNPISIKKTFVIHQKLTPARTRPDPESAHLKFSISGKPLPKAPSPSRKEPRYEALKEETDYQTILLWIGFVLAIAFAIVFSI